MTVIFKMAVYAITSLARNSFFDFNLLCLQCVGLWPDVNWPSLWQTVYKGYETSLVVMACVFFVVTGIGMYMNQDDLISLLSDLDKAIVSYNFFFKIILFLIKRKQIRILIDDILHSGDKIDEERERVMKIHVILVSVLITTIIGGFQMLSQIKGELVISSWMPFDAVRNQWTVFMAGQILDGLYAVPVMYRAIAIQGIVCSIIMYMCDQLVELQHRLKTLTYNEENGHNTRKAFKSIIKKHIRLVGYSRSIKSVFKEYFFIQNVAITAELCLNALMMTIMGLEQKKHLATFMAYLMIALFNAYIFCYLGQELMDQSAGIAHAAYESDWTSWPVDMQKDLLLLITVAQKSFTLSAGGIAVMCMETYALALYNGYSIFAVLRDVVD